MELGLVFLMGGEVRNRTEIECTDTNTVNGSYAEV